MHFETGLINAWFRAWLARVPRIDAGPLDEHGEPVPFDRTAIHPHAFRHTYVICRASDRARDVSPAA
jgi:integrase